MMRQVADKLKEREYINTANVEAIRRYIRIKYPDSSKEEMSAVFADALHKIIDKRIYQFEEEHRKRIKEKVLKRAVVKEEFSINAAEVFNACLSLKIYDDSYIDSLTSWINKNQDVPVSSGKVSKLLDITKQYDEEYIDGSIEDVLEQYSESWAEDVTIINMGIETEVSQQSDTEEEAEEEAAACVVWEEEYSEDKTAAVLERILMLFRAAAELIISGFTYVKPLLRTALPLAVPVVLVASLLFMDLLKDNSIDTLRHQEQGQYIDIRKNQIDRYFALEPRILQKLGSPDEHKAIALMDDLHEELKYVEIDKKRLKGWLDKKKSLLSDEPYFSAILDTAKDYDIHPLLMFAIAGQEQSFVPRWGNFSGRIANNPFNVYGSWEKYNTNIYDSSRLAAGLIVNSSRGRPAYMNPIRWINRKYAEDQNWWKNVSKLFEQMKKEIIEMDEQ